MELKLQRVKVRHLAIDPTAEQERVQGSMKSNIPLFSNPWFIQAQDKPVEFDLVPSGSGP